MEYSSLCCTIGLSYLFYIQYVYFNPKFLIYPFHHPPFLLVAISLLSVSLYRLYKFHLYHLKDSRYKRYHSILWFALLGMIISRSIHVAANGIIVFFFLAAIVFHIFIHSSVKGIQIASIVLFHLFILGCTGSLSLRMGFFWLWQVDAALVVLASFVEEHGLIPPPHRMGNLPAPGIKPLTPVLVGEFLTTAPPEKFPSIVS